MHPVGEVRHIRGFGTTMYHILRTCERPAFQWDALDAFRDAYLPTIRDERLRALAAGVIAQRNECHPLREFTPQQARMIHRLACGYRKSAVDK